MEKRIKAETFPEDLPNAQSIKRSGNDAISHDRRCICQLVFRRRVGKTNTRSYAFRQTSDNDHKWGNNGRYVILNVSCSNEPCNARNGKF